MQNEASIFRCPQVVFFSLSSPPPLLWVISKLFFFSNLIVNYFKQKQLLKPHSLLKRGETLKRLRPFGPSPDVDLHGGSSLN